MKEEWIVIKIDDYDDPINLSTFESEKVAKEFYDQVKLVHENTILTKVLEETDNSVKVGE